MNIGWDSKRAFLNSTGLGVYSRNIINAMTEMSPDHFFFLFTPKISFKYFSVSTINAQMVFPENFVFKIVHSLWRSFGIGWTKKFKSLDVYHGLAGELPFFNPYKIKQIVTIHDILFERFPEDYPFLDRLIYRIKAKYAVKKAVKIIAVSEATKADLISYYKVLDTKIVVIPNTFKLIEPKNTLLKDPFKKPFIFFVSTFIGRKNQLLLAKAFEQIADKVTFDLILIGSGRNYYQKVIQEVSRFKHKERIHFISQVTESELAWYYKNALFSVYPSKYEGFGIPILESIANQCPVLISDVAPLREVGGNAAAYFKSNDLMHLAAKLVEMSKGCAINQDARKVQLEKFNPTNVHNQLKELYQNID